MGRSNWANSSARVMAYCRRCSASGIRKICSTAAASVTPRCNASSTAAMRRSHPSTEPTRTSPIISRVPALLPWRCSNRCQIRAKHSGHRPACRHCCKGVEPAMAPGFFLWDRLIAAVEEALHLGVTDAAAVLHIFRMPDAEQRRQYAITLAEELAQFERPMPVMDDYDLLLTGTRGGTQ